MAKGASAVGAVGGFTSGLLGVGGGIVMVPLLALGLGLNQKRAQAASLAAIIPISIVALSVYAASGAMRYGAAALLAVGSVLGARFGANLAARLSESRLRRLFGALLLVAGVAILTRAVL